MLYPIMTETRQVIDLNGIWNFKLDKGVGFDEKWQESTRSRYYKNGSTFFLQ